MNTNIKTLSDQIGLFEPDAEAYIICSAIDRNGRMGLSYQGDLQQLKAMFRHIRDTLKEREKIGNHPNRKVM